MAPVEFRCSYTGPALPFPHFWEHSVGSDHAPMALRQDWRQQLARCHSELGFQRVRFHGLLSDDVGTLVRHGNRSIESFFNIDAICDFLLTIDMQPFVELSFMPTALASGKRTVFHYRGNVTPPRHYGEWARFIRRLIAHLVDRYGATELRHWLFEVWNEPNLAAFWSGNQAEYFRLYRATAAALKDVDDRLQIGGPATAQNAWIEDFLEFGAREQVPIDFITTHHYPTDNFGRLSDGTELQLAQSRRSVLREQAQDARRQAAGKPLFYTEWNTSSDARDPLHDTPYAAAFVVKTVMEAVGLVSGYSFWTFTDLFEENYFPSVPFHGGFGLLNLHGIPKPAYRAFQLLHRLGTERLPTDGIHPSVDAWIFREPNRLDIVLTNHALPRRPIASERVTLIVADAPLPTSATIVRIDDEHANAPRLWRELGEPTYLSADAVERLEEESRLRAENQPFTVEAGTIRLDLVLPPQSVAAMSVELAAESTATRPPRARRKR